MGIESKDFNLDVDLLAYSGIVLSAEQRTTLQTSMTLLKDQYKFRTIHFWGKILGVNDDYFIVQGRQKMNSKIDNFSTGNFILRHRICQCQSSFFLISNLSKDCINWNMLSPPNDEAREFAQMCQGRFTGDPSHDFEVTTFNTTNEDTAEENIEEFKVNPSIKTYSSFSFSLYYARKND